MVNGKRQSVFKKVSGRKKSADLYLSLRCRLVNSRPVSCPNRQQEQHEQTVHAETVNVSDITAGGKVNIKATEGNVSLTTVKLNAKDVIIDAAKELPPAFPEMDLHRERRGMG
jgi:sRNA-binding protein